MVIVVLALLSQAAAPGAPPAPHRVDGQTVLQHLKGTISWYEHISAANRGSSAPTDVLLQDSIQSSSTQVVKLAFSFARSEARVAGNNSQDDSAAAASGEDMPAVVVRANDRVSRLSKQIEDLKSQLGRAPRKNRKILQAQLDTLGADLQLSKTVQATVRSMVTLAAAPGPGGGGGLIGSIDELASVVPALQGNSNEPPARNNTPVFQPDSAGILELATNAMSFARKRVEVLALIAGTNTLLNQTEQIVAPLRDEFRNATGLGDKVSANIGSQTDPAQIESDREQLETLNARIKQLSTAGAPLAGQRIAIRATLTALQQWVSELTEQTTAASRYLLLRGAVLVILIAVILIVAEALTRGAYRYVQDHRRRRQVLLLRRFAVGAAVSLVVLLTVFHGFGSFATMAGFITAGIAVAMQNVIVSIVAYFFLIGRYGLRVGDVVTVTGITGEVVEVGLLRFYLSELTGSEDDVHSTGRVAVFSNSVIFQPSALLKHPSKTDFAWHLVTVTLTPNSDPEAAQQRLSAAVQSVYNDYRAAIEKQQNAMGNSFSGELSKPRLTSRVRFTSAGCEVSVRYPVEVDRAFEIDNRVVRSILDEVGKEPRFDLAPGGTPRTETVK